MKILIISNTSWYLHNFRGDLMRELISRSMEVVACAPFDDWSPRFKDIDIRYIEISMNRKGINPFIDFCLFIRFYRIYRRERPDVVFHNTIKPVIYGSLAARYAKINVVVNMIPGLGYVFIGDGILHSFLRYLVHWLYRFALKTSRKVLFQNPDDRKYFVEHVLVPENITEVTFGSGVDPSRFQYKEPSNKKDKITFLFIGRILKDKGVLELIEAIKKVKETYSNVKFSLIGKMDHGNPTHIEKSVVDGWIATGLVEYLGSVDDVRPFIEQSDVVVLPSYREGVPKSLLEAMAVGRPIITTNVPGCRETVVQELNGLLIPPRDAKSLADAIIYMIEFPQKRIRMGQEGRKLVEERFDVKKVNKIILNAIGIVDNH